MKEPVRGRPRRGPEDEPARPRSFARLVQRNRQAFAALGLALLIALAALYGLPQSQTQSLLARGKADYERRCAACHGVDGAGSGRDGPSLLAARYTPAMYPDVKLRRALEDGIATLPGHPISADATALAVHIRALQAPQRQ